MAEHTRKLIPVENRKQATPALSKDKSVDEPSDEWAPGDVQRFGAGAAEENGVVEGLVVAGSVGLFCPLSSAPGWLSICRVSQAASEQHKAPVSSVTSSRSDKYATSESEAMSPWASFSGCFLILGCRSTRQNFQQLKQPRMEF